ncbi:FAD dependent oxidoreductase [Glonium stellatum]|uniref:FAD dependent oxidoreductase n=1 Tax=Glonium stellatum TaxID=574774 RepID=A0A8E2F1E4_9PEZI|nr:FAD dependent oxidoreductase [Glonium stellatum]
MSNIVVFGAGVIGLQTAVSLIKAGYKVTVIAKHFPGDESTEYTSPWAGAQWRTHATADQTEQCQWDIASYKYWIDMTGKDAKSGTDSGIEIYPSYFYWATPTEESISPSSIWFTSHIRNFSVLPNTSMPPNTYAGILYDSIAINPPKYLASLLSHIKNLGASTIRAALPTETGLAGAITEAERLLEQEGRKRVEVAAFVNCTGLGARELVKDENVFPIRGQTLLARLPSVASPVKQQSSLLPPPAIYTREDEATPSITYIIPRPGTSTYVLGGTKQANDWTIAADTATTSEIIKRCRSLWPALREAEIEVLATQVGFRPGRKGGARVEVEEVQVNGKMKVVVHQYGHGGAGYQNSIGSAEKAVKLIKESIGRMTIVK